MSLALDSEQEQLRAELRRFLGENSSSDAARRLMDSDDGFDPLLWRRMADELGLQGLAIAEEYGGQGFGPVELAIVVEEMGRSLLVAPFFSTIVQAGQALTVAGDPSAKTRWLPAIAAGTLTATVAVAEDSGSWHLPDVLTLAEPAGHGWTLTGTKMFVVDGLTAALVLVVARDQDGLGLFAVEPGAAGLTRSALQALDPTRRLARLELNRVPAVRVSPPGDATQALQHALDLTIVASSAEQVGGAQRCLDMATEYAKVRVQFGRPIGSFQAIKHKCADMLLDVESARSAAYHAASIAADGGAELSVAACVAKSFCSQAFTFVAKENIQIHGGIGFTWEHDAHLYLRRAKASELLFGSPASHRAQLADLVGI